MKQYKDIKEDDIRVIGNAETVSFYQKWKVTIICCCLLIAAGIVGFLFFMPAKEAVSYFEEPEKTVTYKTPDTVSVQNSKGYIEVKEETVNDVPMFIYIPHEAQATLQLGLPVQTDSTVLFVAQAADIRKDNEDIVSEFVCAGEQLARGTAKPGFCAIIRDEITIGMAKQTPLLQQAIDQKGYFFRQYALVHNGELIENKPKNKSIRRALGKQRGKIVMIESRSPESFHDFSQALIDIGVSDAIYLVGSTAYGWYRDKEGKQTEFGIFNNALPATASYIVWKSK